MMTSKNRAKSLIYTALIGKEFKNNNTPSTTVNDNKQETFEAMEQNGERIKSNTITKRLKKIYGVGKCVKTNSCIINRKCQHKCWEKFTENDRKYIFDIFWNLGNKPRQRNYLVKCVDKVSIKRKQSIISRRSISYKYYLSFKSEKKQVCQQFLLTTLDISQKFLLYTIKNLKLISSEENKNHGNIVPKSKFYDSAQYDDLQEDKSVNLNGPIETISVNSLSADVSHVSNDCLPPTKKNHNINEVKSFVSKNESYPDVGQSKNNTRSKLHKLPTVDKNITDISGATFLVNGLLKGEKTQTKEIKIKQKCILQKNNINVHIRMNKLKKTFGEGKCIKSNPCVLNKICHHKCWEKFTENDRENIFDMFWKLGNKSNQRDYLIKCVHKGPIQRKRTKIDHSRRSISYKYYLSFKSEKKQVCQQFLLTTLDISQKFLLYTIKNFKLISSEENKNHGKIVSKSKFYDSAQYDDLQEEKTVNLNGPIETISVNSLSTDVSHVSNDCLPLTKKNHNINKVKSFVSKNESYPDVGQSKNNMQSKIHKLPTVDKNITDISGTAFLVNGLLKGEKTQTKEIKIKQKCILQKNNINVHIRMNKLKKTFGEGKCVKPNPCVLNKICHHKCWEKFTENDRKNIFDMFWKLGNKSNQRDYLIKCVHKGSIQRKRTKIDHSRRSVSYKYYLSYKSEKKLVCQQFLLTTLDITQRFLIYNIEKSFQANVEKNNACKMTIFKNQFENSAIFKVYQFINKLPALSSRYCSASPNKKYLPAEIVNIIQLYDLYKDYCKINGDEPVSKYNFENIFKMQSHLGFHVLKRKKCNLCVAFKNTNSPNCEQEIKKSHMKDEDECKALVISHRQITDPSTVCASFDIQNVLSTPIGYNKNLYYSRKFGTSNLVVFENITQNAFCYLWGETTGNRGSNEIVSCIHDYLIKVDQRKSVTSVILLCHSSARRNKNKAMLVMMYHALEYELNFIKEIKLVFLLSGQPCMPVESLIATIDRFIKNKTVWAPSEWPTLIRNAYYTNPRPLEIVEMKSSDFFNWTLFSNSIFPNHLKTDGGEKISISKLRYVLFQKEENKINLLAFNSYTNVCPEKLVMIKKRRSSKIPCYTENIGISNAKFNNLTKLCKDGIIPEKFHKEYLDMKPDKYVKDCLHQTDVEDEESEDEKSFIGWL